MEEDQISSVALIVGVTGMAGLSIAERLKSPTAPARPWKVFGSARRPKPSWFPSSILLDDYIAFDAVNVHDTQHKLLPIAFQITHLFWVAIQVRDTEEENAAINSAMLANVLNVLTQTALPLPSKLRHITIQTGTKHYMGPIFDPTLSAQLGPPAPPFREDSPRLPFPNFYYALEDLVASYGPDLSYSIHRASIIIGASSRSVYNALLTLAVYAEICKYENAPFRYPGNRYTWEHFCDMTDARVLAEQQVWAAVTKEAKNEAFNCTNGDVFAWKKMWEVLSEVFEVEFLPLDDKDDRFDWVEMMKGKEVVWDRIVEEKGLYRSRMDEITCFGALNAVLNFEFQHVCSMNKSKDYGFFGFADSLRSIRYWVGKLREMNIIP
ncbi:hypothetical protein Ancab_016768 [Ancistrocladus abbreviatus]